MKRFTIFTIKVLWVFFAFVGSITFSQRLFAQIIQYGNEVVLVHSGSFKALHGISHQLTAQDRFKSADERPFTWIIQRGINEIGSGELRYGDVIFLKSKGASDIRFLTGRRGNPAEVLQNEPVQNAKGNMREWKWTIQQSVDTKGNGTVSVGSPIYLKLEQLGSLLALSNDRVKTPLSVSSVSNEDYGWHFEYISSSAVGYFIRSYLSISNAEPPFTMHYLSALTSLLAAEDEIRRENYQEAKRLVDEVFRFYPVGSDIWQWANSVAFNTTVGNPVAYYGLRMLSDIVEFNLSEAGQNVTAHTVNLTVVLPGKSAGYLPLNKIHYNNNTGVWTTNHLDSRLQQSNYWIIRQSLFLFQKYVTAITKGRLKVELNFLELPNLVLPVVIRTSPFTGAGIHDNAVIWEAIDQSVKDNTDWWWVIYPSHVPEDGKNGVEANAGFDNMAFITGGMGLDAWGKPAFIIDDRWLVRKPPHLGRGTYTDVERRAYLPQWLQHEFFHHLFRKYPWLRLEITPPGHNWFDRKFWPHDFQGRIEPDYYAEALHKRLQLSYPPLSGVLQYRKPNVDLLSGKTAADLVGKYFGPDTSNNQWHIVEVVIENGGLKWKNAAKVSWNLLPQFSEGRIDQGTNSYRYSNVPIRIVYKSDENGVLTNKISGLYFGSTFYQRSFERQLLDDLEGRTFVRRPAENGYHTGRFVTRDAKMYWENNAGRRWPVTLDYRRKLLVVGEGGDYKNQNFQIILKRNQLRNDIPIIESVRFLGEIYFKQ